METYILREDKRLAKVHQSKQKLVIELIGIQRQRAPPDSTMASRESRGRNTGAHTGGPWGTPAQVEAARTAETPLTAKRLPATTRRVESIVLFCVVDGVFDAVELD